MAKVVKCDAVSCHVSDSSSALLDRNLVLTLEVLESLLVSSGKYLVVVLAKIY